MTTDQLHDQREPGFFMLDNELIEVFGPHIGAYGIAVYAVLAKFANRCGLGAFPSYQTIADTIGCSRRQAIDTVEKLVTYKVVKKEPRFKENGEPTSNVYSLVDIKRLLRAGGAGHALPSAAPAPPSACPAPDQYPLINTPMNNSFKDAAPDQNGAILSDDTLALISGQSTTLVLEPVQAVVKAAPGGHPTPKAKPQRAPSGAFLAPAPAPATPAPTLAEARRSLGDLAEHLRLLGMGANPKAERKARRDAKRAAAGMDLHVNDQGLTEALRAALVTELAVIRRMEALIGPNGHEDHLIKLQAQAERLWRLGVDTPEKMKALGVAWYAGNKIVPRGALLEEFQAELLSTRINGGAPAAGEKPNANDKRGRGGQHTGGQLAEWKREHGEITAEGIPERIVKQWHPDDKTAYYAAVRAAVVATQPAPEWDTEMPDLPKWYADELRAKSAGATPSDAG